MLWVNLHPHYSSQAGAATINGCQYEEDLAEGIKCCFSESGEPIYGPETPRSSYTFCCFAAQASPKTALSEVLESWKLQASDITWQQRDGVPILGSTCSSGAVFPEFYTAEQVDALHDLLDEN
ncbi:hypothetical protein BT69DRAFT_1298908 [Atractiella rhizophila]|nr:hypothetical protein BT69DRAFT_1298908 [Atractiella rhizophila]